MATSRASIDQYDAIPASADMTGNLFKIIDINGDGEIALAGDGAAAVGVITEENVSGKPVTYQFGGIAKVLLGGTVNEGDLVASNGSGVGVVATTGEYAIGIAKKGGDSGEVAEVLLTFPGRVA